MTLQNNPAVIRRLQEIPAEEIKETLLAATVSSSPLEEMTATVQAAFGLIRKTKMSSKSKEAFFRLEMEFDFWMGLMSGGDAE